MKEEWPVLRSRLKRLGIDIRTLAWAMRRAVTTAPVQRTEPARALRGLRPW